jgi:glyoxylase-like metal-dependent hydrolase (beta-lactamase superfamily II)
MMALATLIVGGALSIAVAAYQQQPPAAPGGAGRAGGGGGGGRGPQGPPVVEVEKLKDNLFVLRGAGGGGNTAVFVQANGITVVDTKNPGWGQPILDKIKELSPKPVTMIINTHTHGDHVSGNVEFPATVDVVTHENTKMNMDKMLPVGAGGAQPTPAPATAKPSIFAQNNGRGLPKRTFKDQMTLGSGPDQINLYYFGRGHTNGDAWVVFPALRVVHAGDIFSGKNIPLLDGNNGGSGVEIPDSLMKAHAALNKAADTIITGHSTQMTMNDLREYVDFNRDFLNAVREGKAAGKTVEEIAKSWTVPAKYAGYAAAQGAGLQRNVQVVFNELK